MPKKYEWEAFLTQHETARMERWGRLLESAKLEAKCLQRNRDKLRREGVQRARTEQNRQQREQAK